jgi:hypothetical protein
MNPISPQHLKGFLFASTLLCLQMFQPVWATNYMRWSADSTTIDFITGHGSVDCSDHFVTAQIDTTEKVQGNAALKLNITTSQGHQGCHPDEGIGIDYGHSMQSGKHIYYRFWMKVSPSMDWGGPFAKIKASRLFQTANGSNANITGYIHDFGFRPWGECDVAGCGPDFPRLNWDNAPPCPNSGAAGGPKDCTDWHEYIIHTKYQTGSSHNAEFDLYVDGVVQQHLSGYWQNGNSNVSDGWGGWMVAPYPQLGTSGGGNIWFDNFSVDDTWNSSVGPQPNPPTLLPIQ